MVLGMTKIWHAGRYEVDFHLKFLKTYIKAVFKVKSTYEPMEYQLTPYSKPRSYETSWRPLI